MHVCGAFERTRTHTFSLTHIHPTCSHARMNINFHTRKRAHTKKSKDERVRKQKATKKKEGRKEKKNKITDVYNIHDTSAR